MKTILAIFVLAIFTHTVSSQFTIKLAIDRGDVEINAEIENAVKTELVALKDVRLTGKAQYEIKIAVIKRALGNTFDYFLSVVSIENTSCVIERDNSGRVISAAGCKEFLTADSYVGRKTQIGNMVKDFIAKFDSSILAPIRSIPK